MLKEISSGMAPWPTYFFQPLLSFFRLILLVKIQIKDATKLTEFFYFSNLKKLMILNKIKIMLVWLVLGPVLALILSTASWHVIEQLSPGKLHSIEAMIATYPLGLLLSLLTPWGWLMYGGLLMMMNSQKLKMGIACTLAGALLLGGFWPIWSTNITST